MTKEFAFQIEQDENMLVATCHEPEMATRGENLDELFTKPLNLGSLRPQLFCPQLGSWKSSGRRFAPSAE
jgi:hypothetical protein